VSQDFCQFVQISAVHHVPGTEGVPQIMESELFYPRQFQNRSKVD